ncbi:hypothetical protein [Methanoregula sp.]|uniref:hypothetical protein n=1 Tax=Methanoregula sp. TaxID=2052170 RepID=UPI000CB38507|nr:hypothetical protein [Methanoregula sp.]PKG32124.1 MAG: hypothetical protein CW742_09795 [Methanoregula sp.]
MKRYILLIGVAAVLVLIAAALVSLSGFFSLPESAHLPAAGPIAPDISPQPSSAPSSGAVSRTYPYVLRGENGTIRLDLDPGLYNRLAAGAPPSVCPAPASGADPCPDEEIARFYQELIVRPEERPYISALVQQIQEKTDVRDDQARIAISLVQQIPYRYNQSYAQGSGNLRSPSMVLYDQSGICDEKSVLLTSLLEELGYGVVLFSFPDQQHTAVGIRSPPAFSWNNTGYAFVETTFPAIVTDDKGEYGGGGTLTGPPVIIPIADGGSFDSVGTEYADALTFIRLRDLVRTSGDRLTGEDRTEAEALCRKYGMHSCSG